VHLAWFERALGLILILLPLQDLFFTALFPQADRGTVQIPLRRVFWRGMRAVAGGPGKRQQTALSYTGPVMIVLHAGSWVVLLMVGFALIYWPVAGQIIRGPSTSDGGFATALYFSGYSFTTLGTGDVVATQSLYRLSSVFEALLGFTTITLSLTYFLAVYAALVRRSALALTIQGQTEGTGEAARLLQHLGAGDDFSGAGSEIGLLADALFNVLESHRYYPILRYFHFRDQRNSLPRLLFVALDTATLILSALDSERDRRFIESATVTGLWYGTLAALEELCTSLVGHVEPQTIGDTSAWRSDYEAAVGRLRAHGIRTVADLKAGADHYVELRGMWQPALTAIAHYLAYETITPSGRVT